MASPTSKLLSSSSSRHSSCHHRTKRGPMTSFDVLHHETSHLTLKHPATSPSKRGRGEKKTRRIILPSKFQGPSYPTNKKGNRSSTKIQISRCKSFRNGRKIVPSSVFPYFFHPFLRDLPIIFLPFPSKTHRHIFAWRLMAKLRR